MHVPFGPDSFGFTRRTSRVTVCPAVVKKGTRDLPIKPFEPVTIIFMGLRLCGLAVGDDVGRRCAMAIRKRPVQLAANKWSPKYQPSAPEGGANSIRSSSQQASASIGADCMRVLPMRNGPVSWMSRNCRSRNNVPMLRHPMLPQGPDPHLDFVPAIPRPRLRRRQLGGFVPTAERAAERPPGGRAN